MKGMRPHYYPVLTIAGSDSSGGAGIQADLKTISALGGYAMSVLTSVTAQNTVGVRAVLGLPASLVRSQMEAVLEDIPPLAIKSGMLYDTEIIATLAYLIARLPSSIPYVLDPVMVATSGDRLLREEAIDTLRQLLLPLATLVTPNIPEAEILSGTTIGSEREADQAAESILALGAKAVLIKGGHRSVTEAEDRLYTANGEAPITFTAPRIDTPNTHGTGCTLSAAIATYLALGETMEEAVRLGKAYLTEALEAGRGISIGHGHGPVCHFYNPLKSRTR